MYPREPEEMRLQRLAEFIAERHMLSLEVATAAIVDMPRVSRDRIEDEMRGTQARRHTADYSPFSFKVG